MALLFKPGGVIGSLFGGVACLAGGAMLLSLAGCHGGASGGFKGSAQGDGPLVGTWTRSTLSVEGTTVTCPNDLQINGIIVDSCVSGETLSFGSDGTYTHVYPRLISGRLYEELGTYSLSGSTLTLTRTATAEDTDGSGTITSSEITAITSQTVPNTITINSTASFTLTPNVPAAGASYTVPESLDGSTVTSTYTR